VTDVDRAAGKFTGVPLECTELTTSSACLEAKWFRKPRAIPEVWEGFHALAFCKLNKSKPSIPADRRATLSEGALFSH